MGGKSAYRSVFRNDSSCPTKQENPTHTSALLSPTPQTKNYFNMRNNKNKHDSFLRLKMPQFLGKVE